MSDTVSGWYRREGLALLTDFYELTMVAGHLKESRADQEVCFEYFFRALPPHSGFAVAAGLEPFLDYVEQFAKRSCDAVGTTVNCFRNVLSISQGAAHEQVTIVFLDIEQRRPVDSELCKALACFTCS